MLHLVMKIAVEPEAQDVVPFAGSAPERVSFVPVRDFQAWIQPIEVSFLEVLDDLLASGLERIPAWFRISEPHLVGDEHVFHVLIIRIDFSERHHRPKSNRCTAADRGILIVCGKWHCYRFSRLLYDPKIRASSSDSSADPCQVIVMKFCPVAIPISIWIVRQKKTNERLNPRIQSISLLIDSVGR